MANNTNLFQTHPTKVITGKGRLTFAFVWDAREQDDGTRKYSTGFLIRKDDARTLAKIQQAVQNAIVHGRAKGFWNDKLPPNFKLPLRDGDLEADEKGDDYRGHFFLNATTQNAPGIVDAERQDILDHDEVYSGCYARLSINFYPFNTNGNKGIACGLNNLQKLHDGEPLSAVRSKPEEDFGNFDDNSGDLPFPGEPGYGYNGKPGPAYAVNAPQQSPAGYPPMQQNTAGYPPHQAGGYPGMQQNGAGYQQQQAQGGYPGMQQNSAGYPPPQQAPGGYPGAQQTAVAYPPQQQAPDYYPGAAQTAAGYPQQYPANYPGVQQSAAGYPPQQQAPGAYPAQMNPADSFRNQLAVADSILPPNMFREEPGNKESAA